MPAPSIRRAVQLLPPLATTSVGSLPLTQLELALQSALQLDIPALPQLPVGAPAELMLAAALEGLPGLRADAEGLCTVEPAAWRAGRAAFEAQLEAALGGGPLEAFEPGPLASRAWRPFLWEVEHRKLALAKAQLAGPFTVLGAVHCVGGAPLREEPGLERAVFRLLLARALAQVKALRRTGATPLFFLDEPGLYAFAATDARHLVALQELRLLVASLQREGALVGVHCCGNTDWGRVLETGVDLVALDARLSLEPLLDARSALARYLDSGATLSLGIIPTDLAQGYDVQERVEAVEALLRERLPAGHSAQALAQHLLLTPACGLGLRSVPDAERILAELKQAQKLLRAALL